MKKASRNFAVIALLMAAIFSSAVAFASGPYLGTAYRVTKYNDGTKVVELFGEKEDVQVEFARMRYEFIKQGKMQSTYFFESGNYAIAKLHIAPPKNGYLKVHEFEGTQDKVLEKAYAFEANGYEITLFDDRNLCRSRVIAEKRIM